MNEQQILGIQVGDGVRTAEAVNQMDKQLKGLGGTLHVTKQEDITKVGELAWQLSTQTKLPVVVVIKSTG